MSWLTVSIVLSVALTIALNIAIRLFPGVGRRFLQGFDTNRGVRVIAPWRGMIVASLILTAVVNLIIWLR